jgi:hypothetical protein
MTDEFFGFFKKHPVAAGGTFVVGTAVGYGVSHAYLEIPNPYAIGVGLTVGATSTIAAASLFWATDMAKEGARLLGKGFEESAKAVGDKKIWKNTGEAIIDGTVISDVAEGLGLVESDDIDLDHYIKDGTAEQKAAAKQARDAMNSLLFTTGKEHEEKYAEMVAAMKRLNYLIQLEADANGNANDGDFATNNDNPAPMLPEGAQVDVVMGEFGGDHAPLKSEQREALAKRIAALTVKSAIGTKQAREAAKKELDAALKELEEYD